jgi:hypothetical protein
MGAVPAWAYAPDDAPTEPSATARQAPADGQPTVVAADANEDGGIDPATPEEKIQAATIVELDVSAPSNPLGLNDRDFTFELWLKAQPGTEVWGTALLSLSDWDAEAELCIACTLYIRRGIKEAAQRDTDNEVRDRQTAQAAESRRQQAADLVELTKTPRLLSSSDRDFVISVFDHLTRQKPRFTGSIALAQEAFTTDTAKVDAFLTGGLAKVFDADQQRIIDEDTIEDEAAKAEAKRRFARKYAANVVGINVAVTDDAWMATTDDVFLRDIARRLRGDQFWKLTYAQLTDEVLNGSEDSWKAMISTGIFGLVEQDRVRRNQEIMKSYSDFVKRIRETAIDDGYKNIARAAKVALATNSIAKLWDFIEKRDALPRDSSEMMLLHSVGTSVQLRTRSEAGRWTSKDRLLWKSAAGVWTFANSRISSGDFDGDGKRDALLLHHGAVGTGQVNAWFITDVDGSVRAPVSVWLQNADATTKKNYVYKNMAAGDFNGDGRSELAVYAQNKSGKSIILHLAKTSATGGWAHKEIAVADTLLTSRATAADVNNDKRDDLVTVRQDATNGMQMYVALSTASGIGTSALKWSDKNFVIGDTTNPVAMDTDNNGFAEVVLMRQEKGTASNSGASMHVFSNLHATTTRLEKWRSPGGFAAKKLFLVAEDINGDDYTDLLLHYAIVDDQTQTYALFNSATGFHRVRVTLYDGLKIAELKIAEP